MRAPGRSADCCEHAAPRSYLPIDGLAAYDSAVQDLVFGADSEPCAREARRHRAGPRRHRRPQGRRGFPRRIAPGAQVWISDPSWENHRALFENAGFTVNTYPYYDAATHGVDFDAMLAALEHTAGRLDRGAARVLPQPDRRRPDAAAVDRRSSKSSTRARLVPFLDMAYQGFGDGIEPMPPRCAVSRKPGASVFVSNSFSKSLSLYGERVGALSIVDRQRATKQRAC